jgi:hypothetical protein
MNKRGGSAIIACFAYAAQLALCRPRRPSVVYWGRLAYHCKRTKSESEYGVMYMHSYTVTLTCQVWPTETVYSYSLCLLERASGRRGRSL